MDVEGGITDALPDSGSENDKDEMDEIKALKL